jgi:prepilin-type N-terminal cleavage/methylation domain-containing protein
MWNQMISSLPKMFHSHEKGFTLVELLVAMAIIGLLAGLVFATVGPSRESAKITKAVEDVVQIRNAIELYRADTGFTPQSCGVLGACNQTWNPFCTSGSDPSFGPRVCTEVVDPFLSPLGRILPDPNPTPGWDGPYFSIHNKTHPWGGTEALLSWEGEVDLSGPMLHGILFNDDPYLRPNGTPTKGKRYGTGQIPPSALQRMDDILDDGDLATGRFRGNPINQLTACQTAGCIEPNSIFWGVFPIEPGEGLLMLGQANCDPDGINVIACVHPDW